MIPEEKHCEGINCPFEYSCVDGCMNPIKAIQPEPEESQDNEVQIVTNIDLVTTSSIAGYNKGVSDFKSALREEIEKEKVKRGQPSEDIEVGKIIGLQIALQLLDSVTTKK